MLTIVSVTLKHLYYS